jgi:hypothetical protein
MQAILMGLLLSLRVKILKFNLAAMVVLFEKIKKRSMQIFD